MAREVSSKRRSELRGRDRDRRDDRQDRSEEAMVKLQREKKAEQLEAWATQKDQFYVEQARLRSRIKIANARAKPIDLLAKYINSEEEEEVDFVEMDEPYTYLNGLSIKELEDLVEDIKVYMKLEKGKNLDYWNDITVIVENELFKLRKMEKKSDNEAAVERREGIHKSVAKVFRGKTASQLTVMIKQIEKKIIDKEEGTDIGYWQSLVSHLKARMARDRLRDKHLRIHAAFYRRIFTLLEVKQRQQEQEIGEEHRGSDEDAGESMLKESFGENHAGAFSPVCIDPANLKRGVLTIGEKEDAERLEYARHHLTSQESQVEATSEELATLREACKGISSDEAIFSVESTLDSQVCL
ncbi:unnamed protein product [Nezara viridula]|uniref:Splicing factor cactin central domain-containing protein n=1 Tax=Nezara viridula TaxID=85310 RepID=A0A9P0HIZ4_NEZVI|nr:unnamed protein product [Nezara viridula]